MIRMDKFQLVTGRLILREWCDADRVPWAGMNADPQVRRYFPKILTRKESDLSIDQYIECQAQRGYCFWALENKLTGEFMGFTGLNHINFEADFTPCIEIGWRLAYPFWGQGYASEAARKALDYAFAVLGIEEVVAIAPLQNMPSWRVMERIGMMRDVQADFHHPRIPFNHPLQPCVLYRITRSAFL